MRHIECDCGFEGACMPGPTCGGMRYAPAQHQIAAVKCVKPDCDCQIQCESEEEPFPGFSNLGG